MKNIKITADTIKRLLAVRHSGDVFVPECKTGPSSMGRGVSQRLDAWAMKKSWRHPLVWGYEIKVSRSDFLNDEKWRGYLPFCNEFYFVSPPDIIEKQEVPTEAGLLVTTTNGTRLYRKKKASYRDVEISADVFRYILFSRSKITREYYEQDNKKFWKDWLAGKQELSALGYKVSRTLSKRLKEEVFVQETENKRLKKELENLSNTKQFLSELGFEDYQICRGYISELRVKKQVEVAKAVVPPKLVSNLEKAERVLRKLRESLEEF